MIRLTFRHLTGARATQVDRVELHPNQDLVLGRSMSAAVRFDLHEDIRVSRYHARISTTDNDPANISIADMKSSNGTFVNGRLITTPIRLRPGDVLQLGTHGPEVEVAWEERTRSRTLRFLE